MAAGAVYAIPHGAPERRLGPSADTGFGVRRDVRCIESSKRRRHAAPAGVRPSAIDSVADGTVADSGQLRAFADLIAREGGG